MNARSHGAPPSPEGDAFAPWRAVIESMLHAVWLVDAASLRVVAANHAAGTLMGVRAAELVGRGVLDLAATPEAALKLEGEIMKVVDASLGAVARPARVRFIGALPKTRSGKLLRRAIQAVCEGRDAGDLTTMEDPAALQQIRDLVTVK